MPQYTDAKRMHLAALGVFERTGRDEAVEQLVKAACRKFSGSAKVHAPFDSVLLCKSAAPLQWSHIHYTPSLVEIDVCSFSITFAFQAADVFCGML